MVSGNWYCGPLEWDLHCRRLQRARYRIDIVPLVTLVGTSTQVEHCEFEAVTNFVVLAKQVEDRDALQQPHSIRTRGVQKIILTALFRTLVCRRLAEGAFTIQAS